MMDQTQSMPIRAVPPMPHVAPVADAPLVLVVETGPGLGAVLEELSDFLRIRVAALTGPEQLRQGLESQPIAVLVRIGAAAPAASLAACLAQIARHDPGLPVLLVIAPAGDAATAAGDALAPPSRLSNLFWMESAPAIRPLVEFLFMAERRRGVPGLMPT